nr:MAG TPA: hypothetical protein [Caudoviricetes sp.]
MYKVAVRVSTTTGFKNRSRDSQARHHCYQRIRKD